jgi:hypothetical protein
MPSCLLFTTAQSMFDSAVCAVVPAGLLQLAFTIMTGAFAALTYYSYWLGLAWQVRW